MDRQLKLKINGRISYLRQFVCIYILGFLLYLLTGAGVQAQISGGVNFTSIRPSTTGGSVPQGGTLPVALNAYATAVRANDTIIVMSIMRGSETLVRRVYPITWARPEIPANVVRGMIDTVNLGVGVHQLHVTAATYNGQSGQSPPFTIVVTGPPNAAEFVAMSVPQNMIAGQWYNAQVTMKNVGSGAWTPGQRHRLGSQNPQDNGIWSVGRVDVPGDVPPGGVHTFNFEVRAPLSDGQFNFQWRMLQEEVDWFGGFTSNQIINVATPPAPVAMFGEPVSGASFPTTGSTASVPISGSAAPGNGATVNKLELFDAGALIASAAGPTLNTNVLLGLGSHALELRATDSFGKTNSAFSSLSVVVPPPNVQLQSPANGVSYSITSGSTYSVPVIGTAQSPGVASITRLDVLVGSQVVFTSPTPGSVNTSVQLAPGVHTLRLRATDSRGTSATSAAGQVTIKAPSPPSDATPLPVSIAPPHLSNLDAGTLPGNLEVDPNGTAIYAIPIAVPPGTAGMQPALSLNYNSDGSNGLFGLGWNLTGLSRIHRCGKTIAQDGVNGRVAFDHGDRLCLDGQRLVMVNLPQGDANYWADGAEYRTESDTFMRITAQVTNGVRSFKAEAKNGQTTMFGSSPSSVVQAIVMPINGTRPGAKSGPLAWAIDRIADRSGNYILYTYTQHGETGEHLPASIRYGGSGRPAHAAVYFEYTGRNDAWKKYVDEARNDLRSRVSKISTYVGINLDGDIVANGALARTYLFDYAYSPTSGRSQLSSVEACAQRPGTTTRDCLPKTTFAWGKPDPGKSVGFESKGFWAGAPILTTNKRLSGGVSGANHSEYFAFDDFDGRGYTDVLEKRVAGMRLDPKDYTEDYNPIARGTMQTQYRYFHNDGAQFVQYSYRIHTGEPFVTLSTGDFDGDGSTDLLVSTSAGPRICLSPLGTPSGLGSAGSMITFTCDSRRPATGSNFAINQPYVVDVLGDGRAAHYTPVQNDRTATLCMQESCMTDPNPPGTAIGFVYRNDGAPDYSRSLYTQTASVVDFAGVGKPYDVRWTRPHFTEFIWDADGTRVYVNRWDHLTPTISIVGFNRPGTANVAQMANHTFPRLAPISRILPPYIFEDMASGAPLAADFNGAGYNSLAFGYLELAMPVDVMLHTRSDMFVCLSTGRSLDCSPRKKYSGANYLAIRAVSNFVGDGQATILAESIEYRAGSNPRATGVLQMCRVTGDDTSTPQGGNVDDANMACDVWPGLTLPGLGTRKDVYFMDLLGTGRTQLVVYHSGKVNSGNWEEDGRWEVFAPRDVAAPGQALDRIYQVTNGLGNVSTVEYFDGRSSGIVTFSGTDGLQYPQRIVSGAGKLVGRLRVGNGVSPERSVRYQYQDPALDVAGRGPLGFGQVESIDEQTGIVTITKYAQLWPITGMRQWSKTLTGDRQVTLSESQDRLSVKKIGHANGHATFFPFVAGSVTALRDLDGSDLGRTVTTGADVPDVQYDQWGNLLSQQVTATGSVVNPGASFTTKTVNTYYPADIGRWQIDFLQRNVVTRSESIGGASISRVKSFTYDAEAIGQLKTETVEPDDDAQKLSLKVTTSYERNGFGLVREKSVSWRDPYTGSNLAAMESYEYDPQGRFPTVLFNAVRHKELHEHDAATGVLVKVIDPNGLETSRVVDGFGRSLVERQASGVEIRRYMKRCLADCPAYAAVASVTDLFHGQSRIAVPNVVYSDNADHIISGLTWGFDGRAIVADRRYDALGRLYEVDVPRFAGEPAEWGERYYYDVLDRVTSRILRDETGAQQTERTDYRGMAVTRTNARSATRTIYKDVLGRSERVTDAQGKATDYGYDPFDNLVKTTDASGNVIDILYDKLGRKTGLADPDLGVNQYEVDPLGRVWRQTSAEQRRKGQATRFVYDMLGRLTARFEADLESHWDFDTSSMGIGKLAEAYTGTSSAKDYRRLHSYDSLGRLALTTQLLTDGQYTASTNYDDWNRVIRQVYQRGTSPANARPFDLRYNNKGYLERVERGALVLWKASGLDASGNVTNALLGNGLTHSRGFNVYSGRLSQGAVRAGSAARFEESYLYDQIGNVRLRNQYWDAGGYQENFRYDQLNRLEWSQVLGQAEQVFTFDDNGNLKTKTSVAGGSSYVYPAQGPGAVRPHAVKSIGGIGDFDYDDNGNLTRGAGRVIAWSSFDMPLSIAKGSVSSSFVYNPEHDRSRQTRSNGSVVIYAGAQEAETGADGKVTVRTYWPMGVGFEAERTGESAQLYWTHTDRLGSVVAITDDAGALKEKVEYDPWGKRRAANGGLPDNLDGALDNKGFTGHEMLDQLDLVHMNGRVYDPFIGRFLSADPIVEAPFDGQSYNRYSYVLNNPTNLTDPSGFSSCDDPQNKCAPVPAPDSGQKVVITGQKEEQPEHTVSGRDMRTFSSTVSYGSQGKMQSVHIAGRWGDSTNRQGNAKMGGFSAISGGPGGMTPGQRDFLVNTVAGPGVGTGDMNTAEPPGRHEAFRKAKQDAGVTNRDIPRVEREDLYDKDSKGNKVFVRDEKGKVVQSRVYVYELSKGEVRIQEHSVGHIMDRRLQETGHYNVRDAQGNTLKGTKEHYHFKGRLDPFRYFWRNGGVMVPRGEE